MTDVHSALLSWAVNAVMRVYGVTLVGGVVNL